MIPTPPIGQTHPAELTVVTSASQRTFEQHTRCYVLYHDHCADGFGAAFVAWRVFGEVAQYIPVSYGDPLPRIESGSLVYILDFSYERWDMIDLAARVTLRIIDHHATAAKALAGLEFATFDQSKSGAVLTWEYFAALGFVFGVVPELLMYVQDRDLWKWELYKSHEVSAALALHDRRFEVWQELDSHNGIEQLREEGRIALAYQEQLVLKMAARQIEVSMAGYAVPACNAACLSSEVCHVLMERNPDAPFVASWFDDARGYRVWSLRSGPEFHVGNLARSFGGGGHAQAAGFEMALDRIIL